MYNSAYYPNYVVGTYPTYTVGEGQVQTLYDFSVSKLFPAFTLGLFTSPIAALTWLYAQNKGFKPGRSTLLSIFIAFLVSLAVTIPLETRRTYGTTNFNWGEIFLFSSLVTASSTLWSVLAGYSFVKVIQKGYSLQFKKSRKRTPVPTLHEDLKRK